MCRQVSLPSKDPLPALPLILCHGHLSVLTVSLSLFALCLCLSLSVSVSVSVSVSICICLSVSLSLSLSPSLFPHLALNSDFYNKIFGPEILQHLQCFSFLLLPSFFTGWLAASAPPPCCSKKQGCLGPFHCYPLLASQALFPGVCSVTTSSGPHTPLLAIVLDSLHLPLDLALQHHLHLQRLPLLLPPSPLLLLLLLLQTRHPFRQQERRRCLVCSSPHPMSP